MTNTICWVSVDPINGSIVTYHESKDIEEAYQKGDNSIFLENFSRTIHLKDSLRQTTPDRKSVV